VAAGSGLAATAHVINLLKAGDHVICMDDVYGGTQRYFRQIAAKFGIEFSFVDLSNADNLDSALKSNTKLVWVETPTNPTLKLVDIEKVSKKAHQKSKDLIVVVDNTFMSPYFQRPLSLGADIVMHSVTKYLNGHSDVVMGVLALNNQEVFERLKFIQNGMGAIPSPFDSFLALRGLKTLHVRMQAHQRNAAQLAKWLESRAGVQKVVYPGLESHPQHSLAKAQMTGFGGMITLYLDGGLKESRAFLEKLKLFALAESLGGVESLAEHPAIMTHASVPAEDRKKLGISDGMVRLSVGLEDYDDIQADLEAGFKAAGL